jgi:hypothetical protein
LNPDAGLGVDPPNDANKRQSTPEAKRRLDRFDRKFHPS